MGWSPSPEVAACRDFDRTFHRPMVVIVSVDEEGRIRTASYGRTKVLCDQAKQLGDHLMDAAENW